jgi:hypothetical protein
MKIEITAGDVSVEAELNESETSQKIAKALPIKGTVNTWEDEIYFEIPVEVELAADAREIVEVGDLGYWPPGKAFCIFFGRTPASTDERPRAASPVNLIGKIVGDVSEFKKVPAGATIRITKI